MHRASALPRVLADIRLGADAVRLADTPVDRGPATVNPYWQILRQLPLTTWRMFDPWPVASLTLDELQLNGLVRPWRECLVGHYAFSIPSPADLAWIREILGGRGVVEIGAGTGYWAWQLRQLGIDVVAVDNDDWGWIWPWKWTRVDDGNTTAAREHPDKALMLIWPPNGSPMAQAALDFYDGDLLIFAADYDCCADSGFYEALDSGWDEIDTAPGHPTYEGVHCWLRAYRRRTVTV